MSGQFVCEVQDDVFLVPGENRPGIVSQLGQVQLQVCQRRAGLDDAARVPDRLPPAHRKVCPHLRVLLDGSYFASIWFFNCFILS